MKYKIRNGAVYRETSKLTSELVHHSAEGLIKELLDSKLSLQQELYETDAKNTISESVLRGLLDYNLAERAADLSKIEQLEVDNVELARHLESRDQELQELRMSPLTQKHVTENIILGLMDRNNKLIETTATLLDKNSNLEQELRGLSNKYKLTKAELQRVYNKHCIRVKK